MFDAHEWQRKVREAKAIGLCDDRIIDNFAGIDKNYVRLDIPLLLELSSSFLREKEKPP